MEITKKTLDVEKAFREKNATLAKMIPGFVYRYLKRVIHQEEMNRFLFDNRDRHGLEMIANVLDEFGVNIRVVNEENIPREGRYVIAANHPLGGLDGMALMHVIGKYRKDIVFPVNDLLLFIPTLKELFIPVNKHGSNFENIRLFNETFASDKLILYFPAGLVSRKQKGRIKDLVWKKTFITKAVSYKRDIIPVHMNGRNSNFFYNLANLRKRLGIKSNIEMLYLPDEMFRQKDRNLVITFGKPIPYTVFKSKFNHARWAAVLREFVYELGKDPSADFATYIANHKE